MTTSSELIIHHAGRRIPVHIRFTTRKRLSLTVYPDCRVVAKAPPGIPLSHVHAFIRKRASWMQKHLRHFEQYPPEPPKRYAEDEPHPFLGMQYRLRLRPASRPSVWIRDAFLEVALRDPRDPAAVEKALRRWYRKEALRVMGSRFRKISASLADHGLPEHSLRFYRMKRRWGSCSSRGVITLNTRLIERDPASIDYVIIHELCHLRVPAHNREFYELLERVLPDWKERRRKLNGGMV